LARDRPCCVCQAFASICSRRATGETVAPWTCFNCHA
jgi:hypothetical protein